MMPATATFRKMRSSRDRTSPRTAKSAASPTTKGTTPMPIASAPAAQSPRTIARCFQYTVTPYHCCEWWLASALIAKIAPSASA